MPSSLFDLPAELRTAIYAFLLVEDAPISIDTFHQAYFSFRRPCRNTFRKKNLHKGLTWELVPGKWTNQPPTGVTTLLTLNNQVHTEASPVLYGANTFNFDCTQHLWLFTQTIRNNVKYIRHVQVGEFVCAHVKTPSCFELLDRAIHLQHITLPHNKFCDLVTEVPNTHMQMLGYATPLLKRLAKARRKAKGSVAGLVDLLKVTRGQCGYCRMGGGKEREECTAWRHCGFMCESIEGHHLEVEDRVKREVAKVLRV